MRFGRTGRVAAVALLLASPALRLPVARSVASPLLLQMGRPGPQRTPPSVARRARGAGSRRLVLLPLRRGRAAERSHARPAGRPTGQGSPARLRRHGRGLARLRPRRPARLLHRQRLEDRGRQGRREGQERALQADARPHLRGRDGRGRRGRRGRVGSGGLRCRLRSGRLARHPRHELRQERALSQPPRRSVRERREAGRPRVAGLEHRRGLVRCGRRRRPRRLHRAVHRHDARGGAGREADALLARPGDGRLRARSG